LGIEHIPGNNVKLYNSHPQIKACIIARLTLEKPVLVEISTKDGFRTTELGL